MPEAKFKIGDAVRLKNGTTKMLVFEISGEGENTTLRCVYQASPEWKTHYTKPLNIACFISCQLE